MDSVEILLNSIKESLNAHVYFDLALHTKVNFIYYEKV